MILSLLEEVGGPTVRCEETEYLEHVLRRNPEKRKYTLSVLNNQEVKKIVPLRDVEFVLQLDIQPQNVYTTLGANVTWEITEGGIRLKIDQLEIFDVVHIE